jgi:hypothetical protein
MRAGFSEELSEIERELTDGFEHVGRTLEAIAATILEPAQPPQGV